MLLLVAFLLASCASPGRVHPPPGRDEQSLLVAERWKPRVEQALREFERRVLAATGKPAPAGPDIYMVTDSESQERLRQKHPAAFVVEADFYWPSDTYWRVVGGALMSRALLHGVAFAGDSELVLPSWFRFGGAWRMAGSIIDSLGDPTVRAADFDAETAIHLRREKLGTEALQSMFDLADISTVGDIHDFYRLAIFAAQRLEWRMGSRFESAWLSLLQASAGKQFVFETAFEQTFGLSLADFRTLVRADIEALLAEERRHAAPLPPRDVRAAVEDFARLPYRDESFLKGYREYLQAPVPKAFAYTRAGGWVYKDDAPNAMEWALRECRARTPVGCRLYAVDDFVVEQPDRAAPIEIVLAGDGQSVWSRQLRERWLPVVEETVRHYQQGIERLFDLRFPHATRLYMVGSPQDYEALLREHFYETARGARRLAQGTDGLAQGNGLIAVAFYADADAEDLREAATLVTLHELVHDLQNQLAGSSAGFLPPRWIKEGSAEQLAYLLAQDLPSVQAERALRDWRTLCVEWYKLRGASQTRPAEVLDKDLTGWMALTEAGKDPYKMSGLMLEYLRERLGEGYHPALLKFFRMAADPDMTEERAFETAFGLKMTEFLAALTPWLQAL